MSLAPPSVAAAHPPAIVTKPNFTAEWPESGTPTRLNPPHRQALPSDAAYVDGARAILEPALGAVKIRARPSGGAATLASEPKPEDHQDDELRSAVARLRESVEKGSGGHNEVQYLTG